MSDTAKLHDTFKRQLELISYSRAGWDYQMSPAQRAEEKAGERAALAKARSIWAENPDQHDELRAVFRETQPLATLSELEAAR